MKDHIDISNNTAKKLFFILFLPFKNNPFRLYDKKYTEKLLLLSAIKIKIIDIRFQFNVIVSAITNHQQIFELISGGFFMPPFNSTFLKFPENSDFHPICNKNINSMLALKHKALVMFNNQFFKFTQPIRKNYIYIKI